MLPDNYADQIVTSPPYHAQREYLPTEHPLKKFELGCEPTVDAYIEALVAVFREARRVAKPSATCWINIGDRASTGKNGEPKDSGVLGIPWMLVSAMRADGWRFVEEIIWNNPSRIPEGATKRTCRSHEHVLVFAKTASYFYNPLAACSETKYVGKAAQEQLKSLGVTHQFRTRPRSVWTISAVGTNFRKLIADVIDGGKYLEVNPECHWHSKEGDGGAGPLFAPKALNPCSCTPVEASFFAAMPPELAAMAIGIASPDGCCAQCGSPHVPQFDKIKLASRTAKDPSVDTSGKSRRDPARHITAIQELGCKQECECNCEGMPAIIIDPFMGSGVVPMTARAMGRSYIGIDLNPYMVTTIAPARIKACPVKPESRLSMST